MKGEFFIIRSLIKKYIGDVFTNSNDKILDIGCGERPYYHEVVKGDITSFDIKKFNKIKVVGDANFLPFKKNSFDKIIMINSLYYFKNPFEFMNDLNNILKKNGKLIIITPFFYPVHDVPTDKYRFTKFGLKALLEDHFRIEKIESLGGFFTIPAIILHSLIKGIPLLVPNSLKNLIRIIAYLIFYLPYILAQIISIIDLLDKTDRWSTYYIAIATKK